MPNRIRTLFLTSVLLALTACGTMQPSAEPSDSSGLSIEILSPAAVRLSWPGSDGAESYVLEGRYNNGAFFPLAEVSSDQHAYTHFTFPGMSRIDYRVSARRGTEIEQVGTGSTSLLAFSPDPLTVASQLPAAGAAELPPLPAIPTLDPMNPDLDALATAFAGIDTADLDALTNPSQPMHLEQQVGSDGGAVVLHAADGISYRLELPANAVQQPTTLTLTPVDQFSDFPFAAGALAALQVQPPIPFAGPASLTIKLPAEVQPFDGSFLVAFIVSAHNQEFSLAPHVEAGAGEYRMDVYWGDTFGLAAASEAEIIAQTANVPSDPGEQMAQQIAAARATNPDDNTEGGPLAAAQFLQGYVELTQDLTGNASIESRTRLAAPAPMMNLIPDRQADSFVKLFNSIFWGEQIWNWANQILPPGTPAPAGSEVAGMIDSIRTNSVTRLTDAIKSWLDDHDGCRTYVELYLEAVLQILRRPGTPFQNAIAADYRARFGPPPSLRCEFKFKIVSSSIEEHHPVPVSALGDIREVYAVQSQPFTLELIVRGAEISLHGFVAVQYVQWERTYGHCPPTTQIRPFPTSAIRITDLRLVFDTEDRVSDLILKGVTSDRQGGDQDEISAGVDANGQCQLLGIKPGANPWDKWAESFIFLHGPDKSLDNWVITGDDSYVATDTITGRVEDFYTENTMLVLTVSHMD